MPASIPAKVQRLVPLLGSKSDGEALGACRAIGRTLDAAGLDFHDLARAIPSALTVVGPRAGAAAPAERRWAPAPAMSEFSAYRQRRVYTPRQEAQHRACVAFCMAHRGRLSPRERAFIDDIARLHGNLSIRQGD